MVNLQQHIRKRKRYLSDFNVAKAILVFLDFHFPQHPLTQLSAFSIYRDRIFLGLTPA